MPARIFSLLIFVPLLSHASDVDRLQIQQRIAPVGKVRVQEPKTPSGAVEAEGPVSGEKNPGQETYEQHCVVCHRDGVAGAPKFRDAADWKSRIDKENLDLMTANAIKGLNAMPVKGTCQECSEADMRAAIKYMVPK